MSDIQIKANSLGSNKIVCDDVSHTTEGQYLTKARGDSLYLTESAADELYMEKDKEAFDRIICNNITTTTGDTYITKSEADLLYQSITNPIFYDWTPDVTSKIYFTLDVPFTCPCNGWLICNPQNPDLAETYNDSGSTYNWTVYLNDTEMFTSDDEGNITIQMMLAKNTVISSTTVHAREAIFLAAKNAINDIEINIDDPTDPNNPDWVTFNTSPWDICRNAIQADGSFENQYVPDATGWNATWCSNNNNYGKNFLDKINKVSDDYGKDAKDALLFRCQSKYLKKAPALFKNTTIVSFNGDLSNLVDGSQMFMGASNFNSFTTKNLDALENGKQMFRGTSIYSWTMDLPSLKIGNGFLNSCQSITTINVRMPKVENITGFCWGSNSLNTVVCHAPLATIGASAFTACPNLVSFDGELLSLQNGDEMFWQSTSLTTFNATLPSLTSGSNMFMNCILDGESALRILSSIPYNTTGGRLDLGIAPSGYMDAVRYVMPDIADDYEPPHEGNNADINMSWNGWTLRLWSGNYYA